MTEPTQEQIKEFWEWCGLLFKNEVSYHGWYKGIGGAIGLEWVADKLDIDLNNLFKYAVPKAIEECGEEAKDVIIQWLENILHYAIWGKEANGLFWALWQVKEQNK